MPACFGGRTWRLADADVIVIGGALVRLATACHAAERGRKVAHLDL